MGIGFSQSIVATRQVTETFNNTVLESVQRCSQNFGITQAITISGDNNVIQNVFLNQNTGVNFSCFGQTENQLALLNDVTNNITSDANARSEFVIGLAFAQSANFSSIINETLNNTFLSAIQECTSDDPVFQGITITGDSNQVIGATLNQNSEFYSKCVFDSSNVANITNQIANDVNASANSQAGSNIALGIILVIIIIVIIAVIFFALWQKFPFDKFAKKGGPNKKKPSTTNNNKPTTQEDSSSSSLQDTALQTLKDNPELIKLAAL